MTEHSDTAATVVAKSVPPVTVSIATLYGVQVSDLVLWATLIYTVLLIAKTAYRFYCDLTQKEDADGRE